ncbi:Pyridoxamine 5'-phosphate oxidase protein [Dioscorea alata]|uniref:Pyridoxamine 5'-phosphate oxidase protein n=1 Tax=Dioscorea alata TaxID=55571 RepID=A0ACB7UGZ5_DIOAL|nr:Pyridoxamine 5'-phosphate oxidase protein [Dioscorea alata]
MASWKQLLQAAMDSHAHLKHSSFIQLATLGTNGRPANRTVVFRGFLDGSDRIRMHTDSRSCKIEEIKHCPFGEICWYFTESWEQFRINGKIEIIDKSTTDAIKVEQREKSWQSIAGKSKLQYLGPAPRSPYKEGPGIDYELDPSAGPFDAFSLLILEPDQVDYINLKSDERWIFTSRMSNSDKIWVPERVNP